jgi:signal transduction histidine kinase/ActR/RegA family two-component response regulator
LRVPYRAFKRNLTASYLAPFIMTLAVLAAVFLWRVQNQVAITGWIEHSDQVMLRAKDAELEIRELQIAYRSYLLVPDQRYVAELEDAQKKLNQGLSALALLVSDNPEQEGLLQKVSEARDTWIQNVERLIAQKDSGKAGADSFEQIHPHARAVVSALDDFIVAEQRLRALRSAHERSQYRLLFVLVPLLSIGVMIILSYWGWRQINLATDQFHAALDDAERAQAEAEKASERAEKANRAKDNFLGTVSHELRNPLNSILLWSTALLRDQTLSENTRRGVTTIERAVRVQGQLIEDLLDISRIESGRLRLDVQTVDLAEVVKAGAESMRAAAEAKSIALQEILDPSIDSVAGDPGRLQQIVWNLVSNAVKFTPKGGKIQVRLERINSHVEIVVADSGQGIEPASLASVFERFWQGGDSGESRHGVGLGLSIVKELVGLHGGTVVAHSDGPGKGSTFTVRLPLPANAPPSWEARRHPTGHLGNAASAPRLDGLAILVVDDDPDTCDALESLLRALGAGVQTATSVRAGLAIYEDTHPDAIVSDIGMPVEDGYVLARELRKRERDAGTENRTPLIALTAYGRVEDKVQILTAGFDSHAIKPVDPVELSAILRTCIASRRGATGVS